MKDHDVVSASEIAAWAWCPESWRLQALGKKPGSQAELDRGERFHLTTTAFETWTRRATLLARWLLIAALALAVWWCFLSEWGRR